MLNRLLFVVKEKKVGHKCAFVKQNPESRMETKKKEEEKELKKNAKIYPERKYPDFFVRFSFFGLHSCIQNPNRYNDFCVSKETNETCVTSFMFGQAAKINERAILSAMKRIFFENKLASFCRFSFTHCLSAAFIPCLYFSISCGFSFGSC